MHIDLWGLLFQAINFLVLVWLLNKFLYGPLTFMVAERKEVVAKTIAAAEAERAAVESHRRGYEHRMAEILSEREKLITEARTHIEIERQEVLVKAESEAALHLEAERTRLEEERREAAGTLSEQALTLGLQVAERLLAEVGEATVTEALLERVCRELAALPPERLQDRGDTVTIRTCPALDEAARRRWSERLASLIGPGTAIEFETEPTLITGVEMRFANFVIAFSWRESLDAARSAIAVGS